VWSLTANGKDSVPYLAKKVFLADPKKIIQYIKDLDSESFKERQIAIMAALSSYERWVEGVLGKTLETEPPPSEEVRQRIGKLLKRLEGKETAKSKSKSHRRTAEPAKHEQRHRAENCPTSPAIRALSIVSCSASTAGDWRQQATTKRFIYTNSRGNEAGAKRGRNRTRYRRNESLRDAPPAAEPVSCRP